MSAAQEVLELREAVTGLKDRLTALRSNIDITKDAVLRVNVRDARDGLNRRLRQLSPTTVALQVGSPVTSAGLCCRAADKASAKPWAVFLH